MNHVEVSTAAEMSAAILQHAGTNCTIRWGTFVVKFSERLPGEQVAVRVLVPPRKSGGKPSWEWAGSLKAREAPRNAKKRVAFQDDRDRAAAELSRIPRKAWPRPYP